MRTFHKWVASLVFLIAGCQGVGTVSTDAVPVRQLRVGDVDLAYVEEGRGPAVVFVHGAYGDWRTWDGLRPGIARTHRYVSMSRRYHQPNPWPDDGRNYTFEQQIEDVAAFIRTLGAGKVHLVGNSYSGRLVGFVAVRHPELLRSVVLGEPTLAAPASAEGRAAMAAYARDLTDAAAAGRAGDDRRAAILVANAVLGDPNGFASMSPMHQQRWLDNARTTGPMFAGRPPPPVTCEQLRAMKVPALVVRGERTREGFRHGHDALLACLPPTTQSVVIPGAGHLWPLDQPDASAKAILDFVARH